MASSDMASAIRDAASPPRRFRTKSGLELKADARTVKVNDDGSLVEFVAVSDSPASHSRRKLVLATDAIELVYFDRDEV